MKKFLPLLFLASFLNAQEGITFDSSTSLLWQDDRTVAKKLFTYEKAKEFCERLVIGEYQDFRIPSVYELQTIVDYRYYNPALLKGFKNSASEEYWSSTPYAYRSGDYWAIDFKKGTTKPVGDRYSKNLRCVQRLQ